MKGKYVWTVMFLVLIVAVMGSTRPTTAASTPEVTLRLAHQFPKDGHAVGEAADRVAQLVYERSGGKFEIKVFPAQSLFKVRDYLKLMQAGTLDMAVLPPGYFGGVSPLGGICSFPFNFVDMDHCLRAWYSEAGKILNEEWSKIKIRAIASLSVYTAFGGNVEVIKPEDIKGRMVRVTGPWSQYWITKVLGGSVASISSAELYTALQRGTFDYAHTSADSWEGFKLYEVVKYHNTVNPWVSPDCLFINLGAWNKLTKEQQQLLSDSAYLADLECARKSTDLKWRLPTLFKQRGVNVHYVTDEELKAWIKSAEPVWEQYVSELGDTAKRLRKAIEAAK